ncbi:MAG: peptidyl-prolyl cis-trans isomerase [Verrucomicrobiota bacterium]|jgi:hypothetical protein
MFGTIRKHQTWLWAVIITITIISFVIFFSPASKVGNERSAGDFGSIDGKPITQTEYANAFREAQLRYLFSYGEWPSKGSQKAAFDEERETYQRLFIVRKLQDMNIEIDDTAVAQAAQNILLSFSRGKSVSLADFEKQVLAPNAREEDFERFLRHDLGIQQLVSVIGTSGKLTTSQEAQSLYERSHEELATEAVFFNGENYQASATNASPEMLGQFYTNQMSYYRIPDHVQVSYVKFDPSNFVAEVEQEMAKLTNMSAIVENIYQQRGTNYYHVQTADEAKQKIREDISHEIKLGTARKKANDFLAKLMEVDPPHPEDFAALAKTNGLTVSITEPFDEQMGPKEFDGGPNFGKAAFALTPTSDPFAGPLIGDNAVYVIAYNKQIPSTVPSFETLRERVATDFKRVQAAMMARQAGSDFAQRATNELAQGKTFTAICAEAKVKPVVVPPFSLSSTNRPAAVEEHISLDQYKQIAFTTPPGKVSGFNPTPEGGVVVYVERKLPVDQAKLQVELPIFLKRVRQQREQEAFGEWFRKEAEKSLRDTPLLKRQATPGQPQPR